MNAAGCNNVFRGFYNVQCLLFFAEVVNELQEYAQFPQCAFVQVGAHLCGVLAGFPKTAAIVAGGLLKFAKGGTADASCRIVDDAAQRFVIMRIDDETKVGYHVFYLLALVERQSAVDAIGNVLVAQCFFDGTALGIRAVEDGNVVKFSMVAQVIVSYELRYDDGFFLVAVSRNNLYLFTFSLFAEYVFVDLPFVVGNNAVGCAHNVFRGAIVALKFHNLSVLELIAETENVADVCSAKTVDALCVVSYHADAAAGSQLHHYAVLGIVGVLIFIHEDVPEAVGIFPSYVIVVAEKKKCHQKQVVEVHGIALLQQLVIALVDAVRLADVARGIPAHDGSVGSVGVRQDQSALGF